MVVYFSSDFQDLRSASRYKSYGLALAGGALGLLVGGPIGAIVGTHSVLGLTAGVAVVGVSGGIVGKRNRKR